MWDGLGWPSVRATTDWAVVDYEDTIAGRWAAGPASIADRELSSKGERRVTDL